MLKEVAAAAAGENLHPAATRVGPIQRHPTLNQETTHVSHRVLIETPILILLVEVTLIPNRTSQVIQVPVATQISTLAEAILQVIRTRTLQVDTQQEGILIKTQLEEIIQIKIQLPEATPTNIQAELVATPEVILISTLLEVIQTRIILISIQVGVSQQRVVIHKTQEGILTSIQVVTPSKLETHDQAGMCLVQIQEVIQEVTLVEQLVATPTGTQIIRF